MKNLLLTLILATCGIVAYAQGGSVTPLPPGGSGGGGGGTSAGIDICSQVKVIAPTVMACYDFTEGVGSVLSDRSGNGNNGIIVGSPTWLGNGAGHGTGLLLGTSQNVVLPAALNGFLSVSVVGSPVGLAAGFQSIISSSQTNGFGLFDITEVGFTGTLPGSAQIFSHGGNWNTQTWAPWVGGAFVTATLGTNDQIYMGPTEAFYRVQAHSAGDVTSGNMVIGGNAAGGLAGAATWWKGNVNFVAFFSTVITADTVSRLNSAVTAWETSMGVSTANISSGGFPPYSTAVTNIINCSGNSLPAGQSGTPPCSTLTPTQSYTVLTSAIGAQTLEQMRTRQFQNLPYTNILNGKNIEIMWELTNSMTSDAANPNMTAAQVWNIAASYCRYAHNPPSGYSPHQVIVGTMISRGGTAGNTNYASNDIAKNAINALARQRGSIDCDGTVDIAANTNLGADGANASGTYFNADHVHLTNTGYALVTPMYAGVINQLDGSNSASPNYTVATTYAMTSADNFLISTPVSPQTITLPSCYTVMVGSQFTIVNTAASTATTLAPFSGETLTGSTAQAANTTAIVQQVPPAVPGTPACSFLRIK